MMKELNELKTSLISAQKALALATNRSREIKSGQEQHQEEIHGLELNCKKAAARKAQAISKFARAETEQEEVDLARVSLESAQKSLNDATSLIDDIDSAVKESDKLLSELQHVLNRERNAFYAGVFENLSEEIRGLVNRKVELAYVASLQSGRPNGSRYDSVLENIFGKFRLDNDHISGLRRDLESEYCPNSDN